MKKIKLFCLLPAIAMLACSKDSVEEFEETSPQGNQISQEQIFTEVANPTAPGPVSEVYFGGNKIPVEGFNGDYLYQGDILLPNALVSPHKVKLVYEKGDTPPAQKSVGRTSGYWPDNTVYYAIAGSLENKSRVYDAIKHWESKTDIDFKERSGQSNYVYFVTGSGCSSYVGMIGGRQNINVSPRCSTGNIIHEIGHSVGLWHEQSRIDRENYLTINYENIEGGRAHNFYTYDAQGFDGAEFTSSLDFNSIMLYGSYAFSKNGRPTIVKQNGQPYNSQRNSLSSGDVVGINKMYPSNTGTGGSTTNPPKPPKPTYENGELYYISGVSVLRYRDRWYFSTKYGWKVVRLENGYWWYV